MNWVTVKKFSELTGYSQKAIYIKKDRGIWKQDIHWVKSPDGRILLNTTEIVKWMEGAA